MKIPRTKRRLLTASAGMVAMTALEGIACGNPVAPMHEPEPRPAAEPAALDAGADAPLDAGVGAPDRKP